MFLKSIEFCGFKSFAEKTKLEFGSGVTGIVGPNGSGKSNISDAVKWVLGEQSAKTLRGSKMEDVIFNGTVNRKPTSMAEITLIFDNSKNVLPIDYSEVAITRRLFRTGESEYLLNKMPVRLKDIKDMFLDTGIGTDSYSIMAQGNIDYILQSKPEERRFIFEEVAGVSKYKVRREEALRKLEKIGQDMLRINDILSELESQKNKLDYQARKAKQYRKNVEELKKCEVTSLVKRHREVKGKSMPLADELNKHKEEFSKLLAESDSNEAKISELKIVLASKEEELINKRTEVGNMVARIQILEERIKSSESSKKEIQQRDEDSKNGLEVANADLKTYSAEYEKLCSEMAEFENVIRVLADDLKGREEKKQVLEKERENIFVLMKEAETALLNLSHLTASSNNDMAVFGAELKSVEQRLSKLFLQKEESEKTKLEKNEEIKNLTSLVSSFSEEINRLDGIIKACSERRNVLETEHKEMGELILAHNLKISRLNARIETIKKDADYELIQKIKEKFAGKVFGTVADVVNVAPEYVSLVQLTLGDKSDFIVADTKDTALEIINWLKSEKLGWTSVIVLEEIDRLNFDSQQLSEGTSIELSVNREQRFDRLVKMLLNGSSLHNEMVFSRGIISGGDVSTVKITGLERVNILKKLDEELSAETEQMLSAKNRMAAISEEMESNSVRIRETYALIELKKNEFSSLSAKISVADESLKTTVNYTNMLLTEEENLNKEKALKIEEISALEKVLSSRAQEKTEKETHYVDLKTKLENLNTEIKNAEREINEKKIEYSVKTSGFTHLKEKIQITEKNITALKENISKYENWLEGSLTRVEELNNLAKESAEEIVTVTVNKDTLEDAVKKAEIELANLKSEIFNFESSLKTIRRSMNLSQENLHSVERALSSAVSEQRHIEERLLNDKGLSIEDAEKDYQETDIDTEEIEKLKKRIESMGAVNLAAPEEYEQIENRYAFLSKQKTDLDKAREDLYAAINKINLTTRQNFQETFVQVKENFRKIFSQLFEGGEADLLLTDEGNLLETGIDIIAQPPGKKLQYVSLLSGGERSLTAIALLFAIYLIKPSPFCILDEIDGHLDEANILRFTRMLKDFAKTSQFFIITHNKRTLEIANMLYGVSMEEPGVSKIMSVNLEQTEEEESEKAAIAESVN